MQQSLQSKLASYGQWTYRGAWALELTAAFLGLLTGLALGFQAFNAGDANSSSMDLALASAPFFMVAMAELTKIPIATLLFSVSWVWKPVILIFLIALAGITFETVFMGLERAATMRQLHYQTITKDLNKLTVAFNEDDRRLSELEPAGQIKHAQDDLDEINTQAEHEQTSKVKQIADVQKQIDDLSTAIPGSLPLKNSLDEKIKERDRLQSQMQHELDTRVSQFERQQKSFTDRIDRAIQTKDLGLVRVLQDQLLRLANPRLEIERQFKQRLSDVENSIEVVRKSIDALPKGGDPASNDYRRQLEARLTDLQSASRDLDATWDERRTAARQALAAAQQNQSDRQAKRNEIQNEQAKISEAISQKEAERIESTRKDQVRRIAARVYGLQPEDVNEDQAGFITNIWFGSLAALAALAGPLTAIVALNLQRIASPEQERPKPSKLSRLVRKILVSWRWKRVRTVVVPFEVTVEKAVDRIVKVPVEQIVKEIMYVPILTDDPEAVRRAMTESLPKEVANLVSVSMARTANAR